MDSRPTPDWFRGCFFFFFRVSLLRFLLSANACPLSSLRLQKGFGVFFANLFLQKHFGIALLFANLKKKKKRPRGNAGHTLFREMWTCWPCKPFGRAGRQRAWPAKHPASAGRKRRWAPRGASAVPPKRGPRHFTFRREDCIILLCVARLCLSMERAFFLFLCNTPFPVPFASCAPCPPSP